MPTLTEHDDCPPGLPPGLGALIARVTGRAEPEPDTEPDPLDMFAPAADPASEPVPDADAEAALLAAHGPIGAGPEPAGELDGVICMASVPHRPMIPLDLGPIPLVLPRADVALIYGRGGIGKGRLTHSLMAQVTCDGGEVIGAWYEDKEDEQIRPRIEAAGGDPSRVWNITRRADGTRFKLTAAERQPGDIALLRAFITRLQRTCQAGHLNKPDTRDCERCGEPMRDPRLVIIDPVTASVGWGTIQTVAGARRFIEPLQDLADTTGVAVLLIGHPRKDGKLQGSEGLRDALRVIYEVTVDPLNASYRVITMEKGNDLTEGSDGLRFTIVTDAAGRPKVEWQTREAMDAARSAWRDRLAAQGHAPTGLPGSPRPSAPVTGTWHAATVRFVGGKREHGQSLGEHPSRQAAQAACDRSAGRVLPWQPSQRTPGAFVATIWPDGPAGPEIGYAIYTKAR